MVLLQVLDRREGTRGTCLGFEERLTAAAVSGGRGGSL